MGFLDRLARLVVGGGDGRDAPSEPARSAFFDAMWQRLDAAIDARRVELFDGVVSMPNLAIVYVTLDDYTDEIRPFGDDVDRAVRAKVGEICARYDLPTDNEVRVRIEVPQDPEEIEGLRPGLPLVVCKRVSDPDGERSPWRTEIMRRTVVSVPGRSRPGGSAATSMMGSAPSPSSPASSSSPSSSATSPSTTPAPPPLPMLVLRWRDHRGERSHPIYRDATFGRRAEGSLVDVQLDPGPDEETGDYGVVSREALELARVEKTGRVCAVNKGRWPLRVEGGDRATLDPGDTLVITGRAVFVWPGARPDADGFRLEVEAPSYGEVVLTRDGRRQVVTLSSLLTRVAADPALLGPARVDLTIDASWIDRERRLILRNLGAPLVFHDGSPVGELLSIDALRPMRSDGVDVEVRARARS